MRFKQPHSALQFVTGMIFLLFGVREYHRHTDAESIALICIGAIVVAVATIRVTRRVLPRR